MSATSPVRSPKSAQPPRAARPPQPWPDSVPWSPLILSEWESPTLVVRIRGRTGTRSLAIHDIPLPSNADVGGPLDHVQSVGDFPHWLDVCKAYMAIALSESTSHDAVSIAINGLNHVVRFMAWCVRQGVYRLDAINIGDIERFVADLGARGWADAFAIDVRLREISQRAASDPGFREQLIVKRTRKYGVSVEAVSRAAGFQLTGKDLPPTFCAAIVAGDASVWSIEAPRREWGQGSFENCFSALARLHRLPHGLDRLLFHPFLGIKAPGRADGRTPNLPVEDAGRLFSTALKWVGTRAPGVVELVRCWKQALKTATSQYLSEENVVTFVNAALRDAYPALRDRYELPDIEISGAMMSADGCRPVTDLVQDLQTAVLVLVATNQARRKNEVLGEDGRPYGLYAGCVRKSDPFVDAYEIDMYIEKTIQDWRSISCSRLVADSVSVLERLWEAWHPKASDAHRDAGEFDRADRLFMQPSHRSILNSREATHYRFADHSRAFFAEAGVDPSLRRTHIFRRLFAMLYMYRYDHPSLQALSEALYHLDLECTRVYITDASTRSDMARAERQYRRHRLDATLLEELDAAAQAYGRDQIHAMLTSRDAGGPLTRRVRMLMRKLALKVSVPSDLGSIQEAIQAELDSKGYRPTPFPHGVCWAGEPRFARRAACGQGGELRREHAGVNLCSRCPFHSTSIAFLENVCRDIDDHESRQAELGDEEQRCLQSQVDALRGLIDAEMELISTSRVSEFAQTKDAAYAR